MRRRRSSYSAIRVSGKEIAVWNRCVQVVLYREFIIVILVLLGLCAVGCGQKDEVELAPYVPSVEEQLAMARKKGVEIYTELCSGCHGNNGVGGGTVPPLDGSEFVQGDPQRLALIVHKGVFGPIHVQGKRYFLDQMPGWEESLSAGRTAALLSYLRMSWSNGEVLSAEDALVTSDEASVWIEAAMEVEGPLRGDVYEGEEWKGLVGGE